MHNRTLPDLPAHDQHNSQFSQPSLVEAAALAQRYQTTLEALGDQPVRVIRALTYEGPARAVIDILSKSMTPGIHAYKHRRLYDNQISEYTITVADEGALRVLEANEYDLTARLRDRFRDQLRPDLRSIKLHRGAEEMFLITLRERDGQRHTLLERQHLSFIAEAHPNDLIFTVKASIAENADRFMALEDYTIIQCTDLLTKEAAQAIADKVEASWDTNPATTMSKPSNEAQADHVVQAILDDLQGRSGLDHVWDEIDRSTRSAILAKWRQIVVDVLNVLNRGAIEDPLTRT